MVRGVETASVVGLVPPGSDGVARVPLHAGQTWWVGRRDAEHLRAAELTDRHLAVPRAAAELSVTQLLLQVGSATVAVSHRLGGPVVVDGRPQRGPVVLGEARHCVNPSLSGDGYADFVVELRRPDEFPAPPVLTASGTTVVLQINLTPGTTRWRVAHALAWPLLACARRPHKDGWAGRDVADRLRQLAWDPQDITRVGKELNGLADLVADARISTGRWAGSFFALWPPWVEAVRGETTHQAAARRNRSVAVWLVQSRVIDPTALELH